jgi:hypothetical protein
VGLYDSIYIRELSGSERYVTTGFNGLVTANSSTPAWGLGGGSRFPLAGEGMALVGGPEHIRVVKAGG